MGALLTVTSRALALKNGPLNKSEWKKRKCNIAPASRSQITDKKESDVSRILIGIEQAVYYVALTHVWVWGMNNPRPWSWESADKKERVTSNVLSIAYVQHQLTWNAKQCIELTWLAYSWAATKQYVEQKKQLPSRKKLHCFLITSENSLLLYFLLGWQLWCDHAKSLLREIPSPLTLRGEQELYGTLEETLFCLQFSIKMCGKKGQL